MAEAVKNKVTAEDLIIINNALADGADVRIQNTNDGGYRIVSDRVHVLKRSGQRKQGQHVPDWPRVRE